MSLIWTLRDANGVEKSLDDWGLLGVMRERINQAADLVTFRAEGVASDADPLFAHGSTVQLFRGGVPWFYGRVIGVPARAAAKAEEQFYRLAGPWWYLENLVFQQAWQDDERGSTRHWSRRTRAVSFSARRRTGRSWQRARRSWRC